MVGARVTCAEEVEGPPTALPTSIDRTTTKSQQKAQDQKVPLEKDGDGCPKGSVPAGTMWQPDFSDRRQHFPTQSTSSAGVWASKRRRQLR